MSVVLRPPDALPRPPAASAAGAVVAVGAAGAVRAGGVARALTPSATTIRCGKCGGSRPAGHAHCYSCGAKLTGRAERTGRHLPGLRWHSVQAGWRALRRVLPKRRPAANDGQPVVHARTFGDRVARWYVTLSAVGAMAWVVWGGPAVFPASAAGGLATPSEACAWIDAQRVQLTGEATRLVEAQRGGIAQRLGELAVAVGSSPAPR